MSLKYKYDTFNARYLSLEEVANTFIPNKTFEQLISNNHTLLMGPRGCGKTTLLKMLSPKAIHQFNYVNNSRVIALPFIGIYIPSDKQWEKQIKIFESRFKNEQSFSNLISREIVNTNILISLFNTFVDVLEISPEIANLNNEVEFCSLCIESLDIPKPISPTFYSVITALKKRIAEINSIVNRVDAGINDIKQIDYPAYFFKNFLDLVSICCSDFEHVYDNLFKINSLPRRWALCFDELEIAPEWLQKELITNHLRSREQKFLFKLTTTPLVDTKYWFNSEVVTQTPSQNEDYKVIRNWVFDRESKEYWKQFCNTLFISLIKREFNSDIEPETVFGNSHDNADRALILDASLQNQKLEKQRYSVGSIEWNIFKLLAERDNDFYAYLSKKQILPFNPFPESQHQKDTVFRKVKPLVYLRFYFKRVVGLRSRKVVNLYSGIPMIYELADGNPRMLLNLFDYFKPKLKVVNSEFKSINIQDQARTIKDVCLLRLENIKNHPDANIIFNNVRLNLGDLLEEIGNYFFNVLVNEPFTADPVGTFVLDKNLDNNITKLLKFGLNVGAIQYINPSQDISNEDVYNKQYRLSYSLFPCFNLPIRDFNSVQLSKAFPKYSKNKRPKDSKGDSSESQQSELF